MASDDSVIVTAPSVDEAIIVGLTRLAASRDEVEIEVLDEGSRGFLGIGMREAKVKVTRVDRTADAQPHPGSAVVPQSVVLPAPDEESLGSRPAEEAEAEVQPEPMAEQAALPEASVAAPDDVEAELAPPATVDTVMAEAQARAATGLDTEAQAQGGPATTSVESPPTHSDGLDRIQLEAAAREIIANLLPGLSIDVDIEWVDEESPTLWVSLGGRDAELLVGPRARHLHALQYLFRALIYHRMDGSYNIVVDADGYRKRRRRSLESLAKEKADRAVESGTRIRLRAMPAHERRIIHMVLRDDERVSTESVGRGRDRAVTIIPEGTSESNKA